MRDRTIKFEDAFWGNWIYTQMFKSQTHILRGL